MKKELVEVPSIPKIRHRVHAEGDSGVLCGIYFLIDNSQVTYIGQSKNIIARVGGHMAAGKKFTEFTYIKCKPERLDAYERRLILLYKPRDNIALLLAGQAGTAEIANMPKVEAATAEQRAAPYMTYMSVRDAAQYTRLSKSTLDKFRHFGTGPRYFKMGRSVRYEKSELDKWIHLGARRQTWGDGEAIEVPA